MGASHLGQQGPHRLSAESLTSHAITQGTVPGIIFLFLALLLLLSGYSIAPSCSSLSVAWNKQNGTLDTISTTNPNNPHIVNKAERPFDLPY